MRGLKPVIEIVGDVLADMPLVHPELLVISEDALEMPPSITVAKKKLAGESNAIVFIGANLLRRPNVSILYIYTVIALLANTLSEYSPIQMF